ncbi:MAG TPA: glycosyltransferase family 9 protein [Thermomicrobiales bacterium]|nr:glycosyltransferase family 9 protein [Thermomicrobiales bacterium]
MERFDDQPLGPRPHIAVFSADKPGNFVVTTPLLRGLHEKYRDCVVDFFGGDITRDFEEACPYIAARFSLYGEHDDFLGQLAAFLAARGDAAGPYDLAINCDEFAALNLVVVTAVAPRYITGGALSEDFRHKLPPRDDPYGRLLADDAWWSADFVARHAGAVWSNYIGEIFCRIARVETDYFKTEVPQTPPPFAVPDVLFTVTATRSAKQWPIAYWAEVARWCAARGLSVGLLGQRPDVERRLYNAGDEEDWLLANAPIRDLRGQTTLTELAGAFAACRAAVCIDTGSLHIATAVGCQTVAVFGVDADGDGASPRRLWLPPVTNIHVAETPTKCLVCIEHRYRNAACLVPGHPCMTDLAPAIVIAALDRALGSPSPPRPPSPNAGRGG